MARRSLGQEIWGQVLTVKRPTAPGFFPTEQNRHILSPDRVASILGHTPLARFGNNEDLIGAVLLLATEAGRFITGSEIVVDGGFHAVTI